MKKLFIIFLLSIQIGCVSVNLDGIYSNEKYINPMNTVYIFEDSLFTRIYTGGTYGRFGKGNFKANDDSLYLSYSDIKADTVFIQAEYDESLNNSTINLQIIDMPHYWFELYDNSGKLEFDLIDKSKHISVYSLKTIENEIPKKLLIFIPKYKKNLLKKSIELDTENHNIFNIVYYPNVSFFKYDSTHKEKFKIKYLPDKMFKLSSDYGSVHYEKIKSKR